MPCRITFKCVSLASVESDAELVLYFLKHGADINYVKGDQDIFRETVLLFALLRRTKCDGKCVKLLLDAGARFHYEDQHSTISRFTISSESTVFKFLIKERVDIPDLWANILKFQKFDLLADALDAGYELDLETRKILNMERLGKETFEMAAMFLEVPEEELRTILFFTLYEINSIFEANHMKSLNHVKHCWSWTNLWFPKL